MGFQSLRRLNIPLLPPWMYMTLIVQRWILYIWIILLSIISSLKVYAFIFRRQFRKAVFFT